MEEYERLLHPIRREYLNFLATKARKLTQVPSLVDRVDSIYSCPGPSNLGDSVSHWTVFNPATSPTNSNTTDALGALSYNTPQDWSSEFKLNLDYKAALPGRPKQESP